MTTIVISQGLQKSEIQEKLHSRKFDFLSEIQSLAKIQLQEAWKANRDPNLTISLLKERRPENKEQPPRTTRATTRNMMREGGSKQRKETLANSGTRPRGD